MRWLTINKPRPQFLRTTFIATFLALAIFQSCGDPGFNTAGPREDIQKVDILSSAIDEIVKLETPEGSIDLLSGTITNYSQTRSLSALEIAQAASVLGSVQLCRFILPPGTAVCMAMPVMDHVFTLSDGTQTTVAAESVCYYESLCPTTANALKDLFETLLVF